MFAKNIVANFWIYAPTGARQPGGFLRVTFPEDLKFLTGFARFSVAITPPESSALCARNEVTPPRGIEPRTQPVCISLSQKGVDKGEP